MDDVIVFRHLTDDDLKRRRRPGAGQGPRAARARRGLKLVLTDEAKKFLIKKGSNPDFGARPLRRAIENFVEDPLSEELLKGEFHGKDTITVEVKEVGDKKQLVFNGHAAGEPVSMTPPPAPPEPVGARRRQRQRFAALATRARECVSRSQNCNPQSRRAIARRLFLATGRNRGFVLHQ